MLELKMNAMEARELKSALERRLQALLHEIAHTADRAFRADLRQTYDQLEEIDRRLGALLAGNAA